MTNLERLRSINIDDLAEWLDEYGAFDGSLWIQWWDNKYCKNCESIMVKWPDSIDPETLHECAYCEIEGNCRFFPEITEVPDNKNIIKLWLESEIE